MLNEMNYVNSIDAEDAVCCLLLYLLVAQFICFQLEKKKRNEKQMKILYPISKTNFSVWKKVDNAIMIMIIENANFLFLDIEFLSSLWTE